MSTMCHKHGVMHRDLKPENYLFANKKENSSVKKSDLPFSFMQVFSVFISRDGKNYDRSRLYGKIEVSYSLGTCYIFERSKIHPEDVGPGRKLPLRRHHEGFLCPTAGMFVDLNDTQDNVVIKGNFAWDEHHLQNCYDRPICSVIRGTCGYAAIHYTIFRHALQAKVAISVSGKENDTSGAPIVVDGSLVAEYSNWNYSHCYHGDYYQSTLFSRPLGDPVTLVDGYELTLLKSVVSVPFGSSLIIKGILHARAVVALLGVGYSLKIDNLVFLGGVSRKISKNYCSGKYELNINVVWERLS